MNAPTKPLTSLPEPLAPGIPDSFFADLAAAGIAEGTPSEAPRGGPSANRELVAQLGTPMNPSSVWHPQKILPWYDAIIDDMFANPGCTMKETAARLQRSPVTIGLIIRSDLFKSRYEQRRAAFNLEIQHRISGKLAQVAEAALDHTLTALNKKQDTVPLPLLAEIATGALDRLGYSPKAPANPSVAVQINNSSGGSAPVEVSASDLAEAREKLRIVEARNAGAVGLQGEASDGEGRVIEGRVVGGSSLDVL